MRPTLQIPPLVCRKLQHPPEPCKKGLKSRQNVQWALLDLNKKSQVTKNKTLTKSDTPDALQKALHLDNVPSEFKTFINNWAHLPEAVRTAILLLAQQGEQSK